MAGSTNDKTGRVEVHHEGYGWGTVCDVNWDMNDAHVACRQLGFGEATAALVNGHNFGKNPPRILLSGVNCTGSERYLWECGHHGWASYENTCDVDMSAAVLCK